MTWIKALSQPNFLIGSLPLVAAWLREKALSILAIKVEDDYLWVNLDEQP